MRRVLSESDEQFIGKSYLTMSQVEMAAHIGVVKGTVASCMKRNKWRVPVELKEARRAAAIMSRYNKRHASVLPGDDVIKARYLELPVKALAKEIGRSSCYLVRRLKVLGLVIPDDVIARNTAAGRIKPGNPPPNKGRKQVEYMTPEAIERTKGTRFKHGDESKRWEGFEDGQISIRRHKKSRIDYKYIRIGKGKWIQYHRWLWEQENGVVPEGHIVVFRDGNQMNVVLENLELISRVENMHNNSAQVNLTDGYVINMLAGEKRSDPEYKKELAKYPELIETKRMQTQLKRLIKSKKNQKQ